MSLKFGTGETVYDIFLSVDNLNNPVTATTFTVDVFKNGLVETGVTVSTSLTDSSIGAFTGSWSANTIGTYQVSYKNDVTSVFFVTDTYCIVDDSELSTTVYVGL